MKQLFSSSLVLTSLLFSGCYASDAIRPADLPRLNGMSTQTHTQGNTQLVVSTVQNVRRTDGRMLQVRGQFAAEVVSHQDERIRFDAPVESSVTETELRVAGGNRPEHVFPLDQVDHVNVVTQDVGLTTAAGVLGGVLGGLAAGGVVLAVTFSIL